MATVDSIAVQVRADDKLVDVRAKPAVRPIVTELQAANPPAATSMQSSVVATLTTWLRWNETYERVMSAMFGQRSNWQQLQETLDQADELRRNARILTEQLLAEISRAPSAES